MPLDDVSYLVRHDSSDKMIILDEIDETLVDKDFLGWESKGVDCRLLERSEGVSVCQQRLMVDVPLNHDSMSKRTLSKT